MEKVAFFSRLIGECHSENCLMGETKTMDRNLLVLIQWFVRGGPPKINLNHFPAGFIIGRKSVPGIKNLEQVSGYQMSKGWIWNIRVKPPLHSLSFHSLLLIWTHVQLDIISVRRHSTFTIFFQSIWKRFLGAVSCLGTVFKARGDLVAHHQRASQGAEWGLWNPCSALDCTTIEISRIIVTGRG